MESTSQAVATQPSAPSAMPTSAAQPAAPQYATSAPSTFQASPQMPQAPAPQASAPAAQASAPAGNPWQEAFQALSQSLNTSSPSQAQVPYSAYQTPTPASRLPRLSWSSMPQVTPGASPSIWSRRLTVPKLQPKPTARARCRLCFNSKQASLQQSAAPVSDSYLSQISDESLEVLEHFGAEAPNLLNTYACAVEDALIEQVQRGQHQVTDA